MEASSFRKYALLLVLFLCLLVVLFVVLPGLLKQNKSRQQEVSVPQTNTAGAFGKPVRLIIPSVGVNAAFQYVGLAKDGSIGVPQGPYDVAWFDTSPEPGQQGSSIITGHYGPWVDGSESVFNNLYKISVGDIIYVTEDTGKTVAFSVLEKQDYNANQTVPALFKEGGAYLNLITCQGDWIPNQKTYTQRLIVFAKAVTGNQ